MIASGSTGDDRRISWPDAFRTHLLGAFPEEDNPRLRKLLDSGSLTILLALEGEVLYAARQAAASHSLDDTIGAMERFVQIGQLYLLALTICAEEMLHEAD